MKQNINEIKKMQLLAGLITESEYQESVINKIKEALTNDESIYDRMLNIDQEQLVSSILEFAQSNPNIKLVDYLNSEWGYDEESQLNENISDIQKTQLIQNIVDNWSDGGIDADAAMTRIDKILMDNLEDEELVDES
jgi:predicted RNA-binding protein with RPS1 domain